MSIIINGMDMPKGNSTKNLLIYSDGRVFTGHKDDANYLAEELPTAQPERKNGKCVWCASPFRIEYYWIDREGCTASFQDEECHIVASGIAKFCPNCGRKLRGEQDG